MLRNWHFDIFQTAHWNHAWNLWLSGWVIRTPKEWAFVLIILTFIPLWLCGWSALSLIKWEKIAVKAADFPVILFRKFFFRPVKIITTSGGMKNIKKKKSYKEVRPKSLRLPLDERPDVMPSNLLQSPRAKSSAPQSAANFGATPVGQTNPTPAPTPKFLETPVSSEPKQFSHSLFDMDSKDDDFDFNIDDFDLTESDNKKSSPEEAPRKNLPQKRDNQREMRDNSPKDNSSRDNAPRERNGKKIVIIMPIYPQPPAIITSRQIQNKLICRLNPKAAETPFWMLLNSMGLMLLPVRPLKTTLLILSVWLKTKSSFV